tara:strand:+ start:693 stop:1124 length:432 start_codon:yes stop_codon:yes gene_type:complete
MIKGVIASKEKVIQNNQGNIFHVIKKESSGFSGFGEAYISAIKYRSIKAWKMHHEMTLNLFVVIGKVKFVVCDNSNKENIFETFDLSDKENLRLTIPPKLWVGFRGETEGESLILNIADIPHRDDELTRKNIDEINFDWEQIK